MTPMNGKNTRLKLGAAALLILMLSASSLSAEVLDPNTGSTDGYPSDKEGDETPGTGKHIVFDSENQNEKDEGIDPSDGKTQGYPDASITVQRGGGKSVMFTDGPVRYPKNDHNPADDVPMIKPVPSEADTGAGEVKDPPDVVCPLIEEREAHQQANRSQRERAISGVVFGDPYVVIHARKRGMSKPRIGGGGIHLLGTEYDSAGKRWRAQVHMSADFACGEGRYDVYQDDTLAKDVSVLAVGPNLLILLAGGQLAYLRPRGGAKAAFRMVWDTGIEVEFESSGSRGTSPKKGKKKKKRRNRKNRKKVTVSDSFKEQATEVMK